MKVYSITSPEVLERAADVAKWNSHREKIMKYIDHWKKHMITDPDNPLPPVTLELGRQAQLFRHDGKKQLLATMYVIGARQFVEREGMVAEK